MFEFNYNKYLVLKKVGYEEFIEVLKAFSNMEGGAKEYSLYLLILLKMLIKGPFILNLMILNRTFISWNFYNRIYRGEYYG